MTGKFRLSVVIPNRNRAQDMVRAVLSVRADSADAEIIVVDDCSDADLSTEYARLQEDLGVRVFRQDVHRRGSAARNFGARKATGTHVAFLDSDDVWLPGRHARARAFHTSPENQRRALVCAALLHVDGEIRMTHQPKWRQGSSLVDYVYRDGGRMQTSMLSLPADVARDCPWNEELRVNQDTDFALRLDRAGVRFHIDPEPGIIKEESLRRGRLTTGAETADLSYAWYLRESGDWSPAARSGYHLQDRVWRLADSGRRAEAFVALTRTLAWPVLPREIARRALTLVAGPKLYARLRGGYRSRVQAQGTGDPVCQAAAAEWRSLDARARSFCGTARTSAAAATASLEAAVPTAGRPADMRPAASAETHSLRVLAVMILGLLIALPAIAQQPQHRIAAGETLEISVFRVPELTRETVVDLDGNIAFPPLGPISAAGQTAAEIAAVIQERLAGLEIMMDAQVTVGLIAVRPIVIGGDVAQPGAIPYERGMTVRRAIALAGGLGALRPSMGTALELRAEREAMAAELLGRRATLARAQAELADVTDLSPEDLPALAGGEQAVVLMLANSLLDAAREESEAEKAFMIRDLEIIENRIARLGEQEEHQRVLVEQQDAEVARYTDMQRRGLTPQTRVSEEYRTLNELRSDLAEIEAYITDVGRDQENARHQLDRYDARRTAALQDEVKTALTEIAALEARLSGAAAQLVQLGMAGRETARVTLYRVSGGQEAAVLATEATELQPGDLVEVTLPDRFFDMAPPNGGLVSAPASPASAPARPGIAGFAGLADQPIGRPQQRGTQ